MVDDRGRGGIIMVAVAHTLPVTKRECGISRGEGSSPPQIICHASRKQKGTSLMQNIRPIWAFCGVTCAVLRFFEPRFLHRIRQLSLELQKQSIFRESQS